MTLWFNADIGNNDYTIFGGTRGDTTYAYSGTTYNGYSTYQSSVSSSSWLKASDLTNQRLLTDAEFLGR